jgi:hypothetical protein
MNTPTTSPAIEYGIAVASRMIRDGKVERHLNANRIAALCALAFEAGASAQDDLIAFARAYLAHRDAIGQPRTDLDKQAEAALAKVRP